MWIDSHIHIFDITRPETEWPRPGQPDVLYRKSYPEDFLKMAAPFGISKAVSVECVSGDKEEDKNNLWTFELLKDADVIGAMIGAIQPDAEKFPELYQKYCGYSKFVGIRVRAGVSELVIRAFEKNIRYMSGRANVVELIPGKFSDLFQYLPLIAANPDISFVIDHFAWYTTDGNPPSEEYVRCLRQTAEFPNVAIKVSGLLERSGMGYSPRTPDFYESLLMTAKDIFGIERCLFGSDWPPCCMFGLYGDQVEITSEFFGKLGKDALEMVMGGNTARIYRIG